MSTADLAWRLHQLPTFIVALAALGSFIVGYRRFDPFTKRWGTASASLFVLSMVFCAIAFTRFGLESMLFSLILPVSIAAGALVLLFAFTFQSIRRDARALRLAPQGSGGPFSWRLAGTAAGERVRLKVPILFGYSGFKVAETPDELEVSVPAGAPPTLKAAAEFVPALRAGEPAFLQHRLDGILGGDWGVHWRDLRRARRTPSWGGEWRFWENEDGAAARVFSETAPPACGRLTLAAVSVRGGELRCVFSAYRISREEIDRAAAAAKGLAASLAEA